MSIRSDYRVSLVKKEIWNPIVIKAFKDHTSKSKRAEWDLAHSILSTMHNRHVGISLKLAVELAPLILDPAAARKSTGTWGTVLERLFRETDWDAGIAEVEEPIEKWDRFALLLCSVPPYSVMRLAMPVIEKACRIIGQCYLFCEEEVGSNVSSGQYDFYTRDLEEKIVHMAGQKEDAFKIFWKDRCATLVNYSRRPGMWRGSGTGLPEVSPPSLAVLLRLTPEIPERKRSSHYPKQETLPLKQRRILNTKEGGFSGIHVTRRFEDMGDMLMSEFINPPELLMDRLLNTGFLALRREPKREKLRDVIVVGVMPAQVEPKLSADFVKACWFDFIARFSYQLHAKRLFRSEFRWLEGDIFERLFNCNFLLQDLSEADYFREDESTPAYRWDFLMSLGWIPHYMDTRRRFEPIPGHRYNKEKVRFPDNETMAVHAARQWAYAAWNAQEENNRWSIYEKFRPFFKPTDKNKLDSDQFRFVHIMLFLPAPEKKENQSLLLSPASHMGELYKGFQLGFTPGRSVSITWVPQVIKASKQWAFHARHSYNPLLFPHPVRQMSANQIAGHLAKAWHEQLEKEIWNG